MPPEQESAKIGTLTFVLDRASAGLTGLPLKAVGSVAAPFQEVEPITTDDMKQGISY